MCMNDELKYLFSVALHEKLKRKIKGKIFCKVYGEKLIITIEKIGGITYTMTIHDFSDKVLNGYTTDYALYEILKEYHSFISKTFFY